MKFEKLQITNWKQFQDLNIEFHPNLTVLTGANGAGKTTLLNLLAKHFGWNFKEMATPAKDKETGGFKFFTRYFKKPFKLFSKKDENKNEIGKLWYSNGQMASLIVPDSDSPQYNISINGQKNVNGFNIHSHRPLFSYANVQNIPLQKRTAEQAFNKVSQSSRQRIFGRGRQPINYHIKETLLLWANQGYGSKVREADLEARRHYEGFQEVLKKVLPQTLGFKEFKIRTGELVMICDSGDFMLDAVSGGVGALIDLAWKIYLVDIDSSQPITILIDEAENHLHASMQREMLPNFLKAFPNVQFIISTHSPLIIGSVKNSNVYALRYTENEEGNKRVYSQLLDLQNKAKNATEILNEVLGVSFTMPIWVETALKSIVDKYSKEEIDEDTFDKMRDELKDIGLEETMPLAIKKVLDK